MRINNKGDIFPSKISNNINYKQSFYWNNIDYDIDATFIGGGTRWNKYYGLFCISASDSINSSVVHSGFAKVTILDN